MGLPCAQTREMEQNIGILQVLNTNFASNFIDVQICQKCFC